MLDIDFSFRDFSKKITKVDEQCLARNDSGKLRNGKQQHATIELWMHAGDCEVQLD